MAEPFFGQEREETAQVPPPPPRAAADEFSGSAEVTIRTMASDIESLGEGGGLPQPKKISIPIRLMRPEEEEKPTVVRARAASAEGTAASGTTLAGERPSKSRVWKWVVGGIVGATLLFLLGYYILPLFLSQSPPSREIPAAVAPGASSPATAAWVHQSFFRLSADETVTIALGLATTTAGIQPYNQELARRIAAAATSSTFFEIVLEEASGQPLSWSGLLTFLNVAFIEQGIWEANFKPDFTAFVYLDKSGIWPGYVVQLKPNKTPLLLHSDIVKLETAASDIRKFFLGSLGEPAGAFKDDQVNGQPIRSLGFVTPGASFSYGWFYNSYLVFSTSLDGLRQAVQRL